MKMTLGSLLMLASLSSFAGQLIKVSVVKQVSEGNYRPCSEARPEVQVDDSEAIRDIPHTAGKFELKISDKAKKVTVRDDNQDFSGCTDYMLETSSGSKHIQVLGVRVKLL